MALTGNESPEAVFFTKPRLYRWWLTIGLALVLTGMAFLFSVVMALLPEKYPGQKAGMWVGYLIAGGVGGLGLFAAWYGLGFFVLFAREGVARRGRWPYRDHVVLWPNLARVDFFVQQRRLGLTGRPSSAGVATERIAGFRFWEKDGRVLVCDSDFFKYATSRDVVLGVFNAVIAPAVQKAAADGKAVIARVRKGSARQEDGFKGALDREVLGIWDLLMKGELLRMVTGEGEEVEIYFGAGARGLPRASDHTLIEIVWDRTLEVP